MQKISSVKLYVAEKKAHYNRTHTHTHKNQILNYVSQNKNFITFRC